MRSLMVLALVLVAACGGGGGPGRTAATPGPATTKPAAPAASASPAATPVPVVSDDVKQRRRAWLDEVAGYVAAPATIPRWSDPGGRAALEALTSDPVWLTDLVFERDGADILAFLPALKQLSYAIAAERLVNESALLLLYGDEVTRAAVASGAEMLTRLPPGDRTLEVRRGGIERMRLGAAMNLCALLLYIEGPSPEVRDRVVLRLESEETYRDLSATSLQLLYATIEDHMAKAGRGSRRTALFSIRKAVGKAMVAIGGAPPKRVYEPMVIVSTPAMVPVVSRGGGFVVTAGPGTLVWSQPMPKDETKTLHHLEWRNGALLFEVMCSDGLDDAATDAMAAQLGAVAGPAPGHWIRTNHDGHDSHMRLVKLGTRNCIAGAEAPSGTVPAADLDALLASLRASP